MSNSSKPPSSVFIFGCGYVGSAVARHLLAAGCRVGALTRNPERASELREMGVSEAIEADLDGSNWHAQICGDYDAILNCVSSAGGGLAGYRQSYLEGQRLILRWAESRSIRSYVYTSSTSVYPQDGGVWVDESADTRNAPPTGQVLLESEALLSQANHLHRWYVLRLAGIYGPGRHYLLDQLRSGASVLPGRGDYALNMIHLEDIVSVVLEALKGSAPSGVYNLADDEPAKKETVLSFLAGRMGLTAPVFDPEQVSERLKRRGGRIPHRFVENTKAKLAFGWEPKYRSYREGYRTLWED